MFSIWRNAVNARVQHRLALTSRRCLVVVEKKNVNQVVPPAFHERKFGVAQMIPAPAVTKIILDTRASGTAVQTLTRRPIKRIVGRGRDPATTLLVLQPTPSPTCGGRCVCVCVCGGVCGKILNVFSFAMCQDACERKLVCSTHSRIHTQGRADTNTDTFP